MPAGMSRWIPAMSIHVHILSVTLDHALKDLEVKEGCDAVLTLVARLRWARTLRLVQMCCAQLRTMRSKCFQRVSTRQKGRSSSAIDFLAHCLMSSGHGFS